MAQYLESKVQNDIKSLLIKGLTGTVQDFLCWLNMYYDIQGQPKVPVTAEAIKFLLDEYLSSGVSSPGEFDPREYTLSKKSPFYPDQLSKDEFVVLGAHEYSPIQYVRSRLEFFLKVNSAQEEDIMDISIAAIEAVENAVKYGDGKKIEVSFEVGSDKLFVINMINTIKEFDLENEIERGKFSPNRTLMRGVMVMQKLFDEINLSVIDQKQQAHLKAIKKLS